MSGSVNDILSSRNGFSVLMGDVIRVLSLYFGQLWLSELHLELEGFRASLGESNSISEDELSRAIDKLKKYNIIHVEERPRSSLLTGSVPDKMIKLVDFEGVLNTVRRDKRYTRYIELREQILKKLKREL